MPAVEGSILDGTKKALGLDPDYTIFDSDIIMHINSTFATLNQLGVGPNDGYMIEDNATTWDDFLGGKKYLNEVKSYTYLRVRLLFDPPQMGYLVQAIKDQIKEHEWRINVHAESRLRQNVIIPPGPVNPTDPTDPNLSPEEVQAMLDQHIADLTPHAVYDDLADGRFKTFLQNGMA